MNESSSSIDSLVEIAELLLLLELVSRSENLSVSTQHMEEIIDAIYDIRVPAP